jgi:hypothetical protein
MGRIYVFTFFKAEMFMERDVTGTQTSGISDLQEGKKWSSTDSGPIAMMKT